VDYDEKLIEDEEAKYMDDWFIVYWRVFRFIII
jgi:hypothetical protein